jgi:hypothetical protein
MPRKSTDVVEESNERASAEDTNLKLLATIGGPAVACTVSRKASLGNSSFETIDVCMSVGLPVLGLDAEQIMELGDELKEALLRASDFCFEFSSEQTYSRYALIKEMQQEGR